MLLNLSNHPFEGWSASQQEAARAAFGAVEDVPFPVIDPTWATTQVVQVAQTYAVRCLKKLRGDEAEEDNAVHVMGEMTFTHAFVGLMQQADVRCVASTTERIVTPGPEGQRQVTFRFVRFRDYAPGSDVRPSDAGQARHGKP